MQKVQGKAAKWELGGCPLALQQGSAARGLLQGPEATKPPAQLCPTSVFLHLRRESKEKATQNKPKSPGGLF